MNLLAACVVAVLASGALAAAAPAPEEDVSARIIALEKAALDRWVRGDPSGFLEISAPDVVYFDPFQERRLNGHEELSPLYESIRGKVDAPRYEMVGPQGAGRLRHGRAHLQLRQPRRGAGHALELHRGLPPGEG